MPTICGVIKKDGTRFIYHDDAKPYAEALGGSRETVRASHVEPSDRNADHWMVDFSPLGGAVHYTDDAGNPFCQRSVALEFEVELLKKWLSNRIPRL